MPGKRDSRQLILAAAGQEFGRYGFSGARVDRIARSAGVNKQLIFYYFHSKAGLFEVILRPLAEAILAATAARGGDEAPLEQLRALIGRLWEAFVTHGDLLRAAVMTGGDDGGAAGTAEIGAGAGAEAGAGVLRGTLGPVADRIAALVSLGQGLGYVRDDLEPEAVAVQVLATALGYVSLEPVLGRRWPPDPQAPIELLLRPLAW